ncbi:MAG: enoyl-CoA hydratase-related protein, partial [Planctomycetota bacterium]
MAKTPTTRLDLVTIEGLTGEFGLLTLDHPTSSANLLSSQTVSEIEAHLDALAGQELAGVVIVSAKPGMFIAGADLTEFAASVDQPKEEVIAVSRRGQEVFARLAALPCVTIAAIDGICVGGGAELAVWCDRRIMTDSRKTQFGFPEVKLGLFPGWGGTARTPRMIGLANAVELVTGGENVDAAEAYKLGFADDVVTSGRGEEDKAETPAGFAGASHLPPAATGLLHAAVRMINAEQTSGQYLEDRKRWSQPIEMSETELAFLGATASAVIQQKTAGNYPAPMAALELMLEASQLDLQAASQRESEAFAPLFGSPVNRALLNVFFLTDRAKKESLPDPQPTVPTSVSVIGAGTMGQGIAAANVKRGVSVVLSDSRPEALAAGVSSVIGEASYD